MKHFIPFLVVYLILAALVSKREITPGRLQDRDIWTDTIPDWDHHNKSNIKIEYKGEWMHMTKKPGSYPMSSQATATYRFWGHRIDIYTELMQHHSYYIVNLDGVDIDTVHVRDSRNLVDRLTWSMDTLSYDNHVLMLRSNKHGGFVLNKLVKWVDSNPRPPDPEDPPEPPGPCIPDTVYLQPKYYLVTDSIAFEVVDPIKL